MGWILEVKGRNKDLAWVLVEAIRCFAVTFTKMEKTGGGAGLKGGGNQ